jgi:nitrate reductase gamma subunit
MIKKLRDFIKKYISEISILLGLCIFFYYLYLPAEFIKGSCNRYSAGAICQYNHHYFGKTFGIFLIVLGILVIIRRFTNKNSK